MNCLDWWQFTGLMICIVAAVVLGIRIEAGLFGAQPRKDDHKTDRG